MISVLLCRFKGCFWGFFVVALQYQSFLSHSVKGPSVCQGELQQLLQKITSVIWNQKELRKGGTFCLQTYVKQVNGMNWGPCLDLPIKCHLIGKWANKIPFTSPQSVVRSFTEKCAYSCVSSVPGKFMVLLRFLFFFAPSSGDIY